MDWKSYIEGLERARQFIEDAARDSTVYMSGPSEYQKGKAHVVRSANRRIDLHIASIERTNGTS